MVLAVLGCQAKAQDASTGSEAASAIVVRDTHGSELARVQPGPPCAAKIGDSSLTVAGPPLVAQVGEEHWTGDARANGTVLLRGDAAVARVVDRDPELAIYDPAGIPLVRIVASNGTATVADAASRLLRHATLQAGSIAIDSPALVVTGTSDPRLAALLTASELQPQVRMLSVCNHFLEASR